MLVTIIIVSSDSSFVSLGENAFVDFPLFPVLKPLVFSDDCEELVAVIGFIVVPKKGTVGQDEDEFFLDSNPDMGESSVLKYFQLPDESVSGFICLFFGGWMGILDDVLHSFSEVICFELP